MIVKRQKWFDHKFNLGIHIGWTENVLCRLRNTEILLKHYTQNLSEEKLSYKPHNKYSIKEHIGHLTDLEPLWQNRFLQFEDGVPELVAADLKNTKTAEADHNEQSIESMIQKFTLERGGLLRTITGLSENAQKHTALHPRLKTPMRPIDLMFFVAEHDTHHLTSIRSILYHND